MNRRAFWVLGIFVALVALLAAGLTLNPREVPSPLVGKAAPPFELPLLREPDKRFASKERLGSVWLLNVWASWCVSCRDEHPVLLELSKSGAVALYGLYGVPETYVIDKRGFIRYKQIGPVTREILAQKILPLVGQLSRE